MMNDVSAQTIEAWVTAMDVGGLRAIRSEDSSSVVRVERLTEEAFSVAQHHGEEDEELLTDAEMIFVRSMLDGSVVWFPKELTLSTGCYVNAFELEDDGRPGVTDPTAYATLMAFAENWIRNISVPRRENPATPGPGRRRRPSPHSREGHSNRGGL
jgi:hypothetical protein